MEGRPGQAGVQYDDVRGEVAADVSDRLGNDLQDAAAELGFTGGGFVVGVSIYGGDEGIGSKPELVDVTFQVVPEVFGVDAINKLTAKNGELVVNEYHKDGVSIVAFLRCFKRFNLGLFHKGIEATTISVRDDIEIGDDV